MSRAPCRRREVIVEARDLDNDARRRDVVVVEQPNDRDAQRWQLEKVVGALHPQAHLRSYFAGTASFLGPDHLIVAHYGSVLNEGSADPVIEQPTLPFVA